MTGVAGFVDFFRRQGHCLQTGSKPLAKNGKLLVPWLSEQIENNRARTVFGESPIDCTARKILSLWALEDDFHVLESRYFSGWMMMNSVSAVLNATAQIAL